MRQRRPDPADASQIVIDFDAISKRVTVDAETIAVQLSPFSIDRGWIDTGGKTRTWYLKDPYGTQLAAITTKGAAKKLADLLNCIYQLGPIR